MRVRIKTQGCSLNQSDSEAMAGYLLKAGHEVVERDADVIVYNTCTVKDPSQDRFLAQLKKTSKPVVVAGCIPQADKRGLLEGYAVIGTEQLHRIGEAVEASAQGRGYRSLQKSEHPRLNIPKARINEHIEIVPICAGCLSSCTYCKTKQARGTLKSYRPMDIQGQCESAIEDGVKELWLTSQDNGAYGMDIKTNPAALLGRIASLDGDFMVRFGMTNPDWTKRWLEQLIQAYKHPKVYKFLHLPIQSGSDAVLEHMGRRCTAQDIKDIVTAFREAIPGITIATDIICGYPTETEEDFEQTLQLVKELRFPVVNISKFYARPDTPAAALKQLDTKVKKERSRRLTELFETAPFTLQHDHLIGSTLRTLFTERNQRSLVGRTRNYTPVIVAHQKGVLGTWQNVEIRTTTRDDVRGIIKGRAND